MQDKTKIKDQDTDRKITQTNVSETPLETEQVSEDRTPKRDLSLSFQPTGRVQRDY